MKHNSRKVILKSQVIPLYSHNFPARNHHLFPLPVLLQVSCAQTSQGSISHVLCPNPQVSLSPEEQGPGNKQEADVGSMGGLVQLACFFGWKCEKAIAYARSVSLGALSLFGREEAKPLCHPWHLFSTSSLRAVAKLKLSEWWDGGAYFFSPLPPQENPPLISQLSGIQNKSRFCMRADGAPPAFRQRK